MDLMKGFRDKQGVLNLLNKIKKEASHQRVYNIMEICGTHTVSISKWGIRGLLPSNIKLISGPGCPVCVTSQGEIDLIFDLLENNNVTLAVYGDLMKVPGSDGRNLISLRSSGKKIIVLNSVLELLNYKHTDQIVFVSIGFETTTPQTAFLIEQLAHRKINNVTVLLFNKTLPNVLGVILEDPKLTIDGFLCPGHVSTITGEELYEPIVRKNKAAVIAGFEPIDILNGIYEIIKQVNTGSFSIVNSYKRVVRGVRNDKAISMLYKVFEVTDAVWRGIGIIEKSGLKIRKEFEQFDAFKRYALIAKGYMEREGCRCGDVLKGYIKPFECSLYGNVCTTESPYGPCMVSSEGTCAAYYTYGEQNG
ncbi:MAG: hydrogenase formation protein HypD [Calditerrivibrio sp.]|nr:hydrogenase formation protein HypD [Calditerrivibrio sp.]